MKFTYEAYLNMLKRLNDRGYQFANYHNWDNFDKTVILRHDVDNSLKKAAAFSDWERKGSRNGGGIFYTRVYQFL